MIQQYYMSDYVHMDISILTSLSKCEYHYILKHMHIFYLFIPSTFKLQPKVSLVFEATALN